MKNSKKAQRNYFLRIPNDAEGRAFYKQLKGYMNTNSYALDRKASGNRTRMEYRNSFNTTMAEADSIRVYVQAKTPEGNKQLGVRPSKDVVASIDSAMPVSKAQPRRKFLGII